MKSRRSDSIAGYSLIEMMVALVFGLLIMGGVLQIYMASKSSYRVQESLGRIQENARFAIEQISRDIRLVGFGGNNYQTWSVKETTEAGSQLGVVNGECFNAPFRWAAPMITSGDIPTSIFGENDAAGTLAPCAQDYALGDVLSVHFAEPEAIEDGDLAANQLYVRTSLQQGVVFRCQINGNCIPADAPAASNVVANFPVYAATYYVRDYAETSGDGVNTLVRARLDPAGEVVHEPIIEHVAHLQFQYGVDANGDDVVDQYLNANQIGDYTSAAGMQSWRDVMTVRTWLLLRSKDKEPNRQVTTTSYELGDISSFSIDTDYRYELFVTTTMIRNRGV